MFIQLKKFLLLFSVRSLRTLDPRMTSTRDEVKMLQGLVSSHPDLQALLLRSLLSRSADRETPLEPFHKRRPGGSCVSGCLSQGGMSFVRCKSLCR